MEPPIDFIHFVLACEKWEVCGRRGESVNPALFSAVEKKKTEEKGVAVGGSDE